MTRHSFGFGTAVVADLINEYSPTGNTYREKLLENFNQIVFENDLKWPPWIGLWGPNWNWYDTQSALDWLDANNLPARGHYLSWATWSGNDAWGASSNIMTLKDRLFDHITDKAGTVGDRVFEWDVINHPVGWLNDTYENRMESAGLYAEGLDFYADIIDHARSAAPDGMDMWINEDNIIAGNANATRYEQQINYLISKGTSPDGDSYAPDGIGFQGHFIEEWGRISGTPITQLYDRIDRFADESPRLRVTEFDIDVRPNIGGGQLGPDNPVLQGQLMHNYLKVMFSHPNMEAITLWGFWGGAHWRGEAAALYETDWDEKPSLLAYQNLVLNEWWTDGTGTSDAAGKYEVRAFRGHYEITVTVNGQGSVLTGVLLDSDMSITLSVMVGDLDIATSEPPDGAIDARQPSDLDGSNPAGWDKVLLVFSGDPAGLTPASFTLESAGGKAPAIADLVVAGQQVTVLFDRPVAPGTCTTLRHPASGSQVRLGYLPGDVSADGTSAPLDILTLIDALNGVVTLPDWSCNIDRSGACGPLDILRLIDLLNGAGALQSWNGAELPQCP